jgi:hypothetical protein
MKRFVAIALLLFVGASSACSKGDDDDGAGTNTGTGGSSVGTSGSGSSGSGASGSGASGSGASGKGNAGEQSGASGKGGDELMCVNPGMVNSTCPTNLPPITGSCAPHGDCCYRTSNTARIAALGPDDTAVLEYRLNFVDITNHPLTVGTRDLMNSAVQRADVCSGEQCLLWRMTIPRQGGKFIKGASEVEIGVGAYNCDGTYSFYGPNAAPDRSSDVGESDPGRWQAVKVPAEFDPDKQGIDRFHIPWATNKNREVARSIFIWPSDYTIDWELASSGFEITQLDTSEAGEDCQGSRDRIKWATVDGFVSYSPLKGNDKDISNQTQQTYCSLLAFGVLPEGMKNTDCITTARCMPGSANCLWKKLPDSLCPDNDDERKIFGCHLGDTANLNAEMGYPATLKCTPEKPTTPLDPDMGATSDGQCCDPLGQSTTLPACNAFRTVGKFVAAAAEITDDPITGLPPKCI